MDYRCEISGKLIGCIRHYFYLQSRHDIRYLTVNAGEGSHNMETHYEAAMYVLPKYNPIARVHMHTRTHARTHASTHARTHCSL